MFSSANPWPISQLVQSPLLSNRSFVYKNTSKRNHIKIQQVKLVVLATGPLSTADVPLKTTIDPVQKNDKLSSKELSPCISGKNVNWDDEFNGFPIKEGEKDGNLDFVGLRANKFMGAIKRLTSKERADVFTSMEKDTSRKRRDWTIYEFNELLMSLVTANEQEMALKLYNDIASYGLEPDCWTFSIMVRCYCKKNDLVEAGQVLDHMVEKGLKPNVSTFTIVINSLCRSGRVQRAFGVSEVMGRVGCEPSIHTYNCLLKGLCYVGRVEEAFDMLMDIKKNGALEPDMYTYTAVMDGFCKVGRTNEARELLNEAVERGLTPSVVSFNTLFNGYCKEGKPMRGFGVLRLMKERNCVPDCISYSTLLNGLLLWGKTRAALGIFKEMVGLGFEVDQRMVNSLLRGLCIMSLKQKDMLDDVCQVFEEMKSKISAADAVTYGLVIQALCVGKRTDEALVHLHHMIGMGCIPRTITFNNMIQALSGEGKVDEALLVVFVTCDHGKIPSKTSYDILIKKLNQMEKSLVACVVYGAALKQGVVPHRKPLVVHNVVHQLQSC